MCGCGRLWRQVERVAPVAPVAPAAALGKQEWDVATAWVLRCFHSKDIVFSCMVSNDGSLMCTASHDKTVRVWSMQDGACVATLAGHVNKVFEAVFTPDGTTILSASVDGTTKVWDFSSFTIMTPAVHALAAAPDGVVPASLTSAVKQLAMTPAVTKSVKQLVGSQLVHWLEGAATNVGTGAGAGAGAGSDDDSPSPTDAGTWQQLVDWATSRVQHQWRQSERTATARGQQLAQERAAHANELTIRAQNLQRAHDEEVARLTMALEEATSHHAQQEAALRTAHANELTTRVQALQRTHDEHVARMAMTLEEATTRHVAHTHTTAMRHAEAIATLRREHDYALHMCLVAEEQLQASIQDTVRDAECRVRMVMEAAQARATKEMERRHKQALAEVQAALTQAQLEHAESCAEYETHVEALQRDITTHKRQVAACKEEMWRMQVKHADRLDTVRMCMTRDKRNEIIDARQSMSAEHIRHVAELERRAKSKEEALVARLLQRHGRVMEELREEMARANARHQEREAELELQLHETTAAHGTALARSPSVRREPRHTFTPRRH